jgi:hypothetical protein
MNAYCRIGDKARMEATAQTLPSLRWKGAASARLHANAVKLAQTA